jgi:membrane-bound lytic murein transglycosylase B
VLLGAGAWLASSALAPAFASVDGFVAGVWKSASARGVSRRTFDAAMGGFRPLSSVIKLTGAQAEFVSTTADYVEKRASASRTGTGRDMRHEWAQTLAAVAHRYGVQPEAILAIWGMETNYGGYMGNTNTVHALATLTYEGYRASYFGKELITALEILEAGHVTPKKMIGSWAGAMGQTQFMPSSFMRYAVDFHGDGHKDIWGSVPDALASTGNYLSEHGWRPGETWGYEVKFPQGFDYDNVWSGRSAALGEWQALGVVRANGKAFPRPTDKATLLMPMGAHGPVFAMLPNFSVIKRYNNSNNYALAVGHLADRIIGGGGFATPWPNDTGLSEAQRVQLQQALLRRGYAIGSADGAIGPKSRGAIMDFQRRNGMIPDGFASGNLLRALT